MVCIRTWLDSDNPTSFVSIFHWQIISHNTTYLVDSIRPVLCLQAESAVLQISKTTLSCYRTIQEIGSVELDSWLARRNLQNTSTGWVTDPRTNRCYSSLNYIHLFYLCDILFMWVRKCHAGTWQRVFLSTLLWVKTDRSCGQTLSQELPSVEHQQGLVFEDQKVCLPQPWSLLWRVWATDYTPALHLRHISIWTHHSKFKKSHRVVPLTDWTGVWNSNGLHNQRISLTEMKH